MDPMPFWFSSFIGKPLVGILPFEVAPGHFLCVCVRPYSFFPHSTYSFSEKIKQVPYAWRICGRWTRSARSVVLTLINNCILKAYSVWVNIKQRRWSGIGGRATRIVRHRVIDSQEHAPGILLFIVCAWRFLWCRSVNDLLNQRHNLQNGKTAAATWVSPFTNIGMTLIDSWFDSRTFSSKVNGSQFSYSPPHGHAKIARLKIILRQGSNFVRLTINLVAQCDDWFEVGTVGCY